MTLTALIGTALAAIIGIIVRVLWDRKIGRHLRAKWNRAWLEKRGIVEGETLVRRPTATGFEIWRVEEIDGGDVRLSTKDSGPYVEAWLPLRTFRQAIEVVKT